MAACPRSSPGSQVAVGSPKPPKAGRRRGPIRPPFESVASLIAARAGLRRVVATKAPVVRRRVPGVNVSAEPSASIWEVTRMILDSPGTSPSVIAHAHGFSAVEVTELLPIFFDNLRADFSSADEPAPALVPPAPQPGETPEEHADRYLRELAQNEHLDVVGYDTLGATDGDLDGGDLDGDLDSDDLDNDDLDNDDLDNDLDLDGDLDTDSGQDPSFLDGTPEANPQGETVELDDAVDGFAEADQPGPDLAEDDPFAASVPPGTDAPGTDDSFDDGAPEDGAPAGVDDPDEPFAMS
jgi:hypothetical protein